MNPKLAALARLYGIQTSYIDMAGRPHDAHPETLLLVLRAMGAGINGVDDAPAALKRRKDELRDRRHEPVLVAWDGKLGRRRFEPGYHEVEIDGRPAFVISAPSKAYAAPSSRCWGLFAPVYALHSRRNPYAGDLTDFEQLMEWMDGLGGTVAATLPLLAAFLDEPFEPSPYSPASRLFWNEFYVDPERIPEFDGAPAVQRPKKTKLVDYRAVMAYKRRILEDLSQKFFSNGSTDRMRAFRNFLRRNRAVEDYAQFRAVMERRGTLWHDWPARLRGGHIRKDDFDEKVKNYYLYSQWIIQDQLETVSQRADRRGQMLYLDLPLGLHPAGYDVWRNRDLFVEGAAGGAPPDPVFTKGQNWGFPPMNPEAMRLNKYRYVIDYLRNHFRFAKLIRIDHVMGIHRLYWIPNGLTGDKGVYVEYPADELWAILCLESHRHRAGIVGENLGTVPPEVNRSMAAHDIHQMYVAQYELMGDPNRPELPPPPAKSVASVNTHDMPPFQAFWEGLDIDDRRKLGLINEKMARQEHRQRAKMRKALIAAHRRRAGRRSGDLRDDARDSYTEVLRLLSDSAANTVLVNLEDLWGETLPQNVPATSAERPNWRRRVRRSLEQIRTMADAAEVLSHVFADGSRSLSV